MGRRGEQLKRFGFLALVLGAAILAAPAWAQSEAKGVVFHDRNGDGRRGPGEEGLRGVAVSNGREVVTTDARGVWRLPVGEDTPFFVIKPRGWACPVDRNGLPQFYYLHKPNGSPRLRYPGVAPTGPLPASIDFPLRRQREADRFVILVFGDPQPRNLWEVEMLAHDFVAPIAARGPKAAFALVLGDLVFDPLDLHEPVVGAMGRLGIPMHYVQGNHDENYDADSDRHADEGFERVFGPPTYAFNYGRVHFLVLDDILFHPRDAQGRVGYHAELTEQQLEFIRNDLALVPKDRLIVYAFHIPVVELRNKEEFLKLFAGREHVFGLSAHTHTQYHLFLGPEHGWQGKQPHHHLVHVTACGNWWGGKPDYYGIPHATTSDGVPNGYSIVTFDGNRYRVEYRPARLPDDYQMQVWVPDVVPANQVAATNVYVNVFAGSSRSTVEMRVGDTGEWTRLTQVPAPEAADVEAYRRVFSERMAPRAKYENEYTLTGPVASQHLWAGKLPAGTAPGYHLLRVRTTDMFGQTYTAARVFRVE